jgi:hypothetical protein
MWDKHKSKTTYYIKVFVFPFKKLAKLNKTIEKARVTAKIKISFAVGLIFYAPIFIEVRISSRVQRKVKKTKFRRSRDVPIRSLS